MRRQLHSLIGIGYSTVNFKIPFQFVYLVSICISDFPYLDKIHHGIEKIRLKSSIEQEQISSRKITLKASGDSICSSKGEISYSQV
jgi:hypothetical protein